MSAYDAVDGSSTGIAMCHIAVAVLQCAGGSSKR